MASSRMNPTPTDSSPSRPTHPTALVIEPVLPHLLSVLSVLSALGFDATVAETYQDAKASLYSHQPTLLVTGLKLREYNGLQLVLRGTDLWPRLAAIVTAEEADPVLAREAERLGATFVVMPMPFRELEAAICRTVLASPRLPGAREPVRPPFERRTSETMTSESARQRRDERRRNAIDAIRIAAAS